jgi:hypothetical protein
MSSGGTIGVGTITGESIGAIDEVGASAIALA